MQPQTLIAVRDVEASSLWYQQLLGLRSDHGGPNYERLVADDVLVLQLHNWETEHDHGRIGDPGIEPGNGVLLWFGEVADFDAVVERAGQLDAAVVMAPHRNPPEGEGNGPGHREIWIKDPDGYTVVIASPDGEAFETSPDHGSEEGQAMDAALMADAIGGFEQRLSSVDASQWNAATPCDDWDVRTLVNHVVAELLWIPPLLGGKTIAEVGDRFDGDILGSDPLATYVSAAGAARAAASETGAQERTVHLSFGDFAGSEYLGQVISDVVIHSWDLARAIGADDRLDPALVAFVDDFLSPQIDAWRAAGAFGPAIDVGPDADAQDRLLAQTGRSSKSTA